MKKVQILSLIWLQAPCQVEMALSHDGTDIAHVILMIQGWVRVLLVGCLMGGLGCTRLAPNQVQDNEIERAESLMSKGKNEEARQILIRLNEQQPAWARPKILLSAIEMTHLQFDVSALFPLIRTFVDAPAKTQLPANTSRTRRSLKELKDLIAEVELIVERFEKIPTVSAQDLVALEKAQEWIQDIESPTPGQALYRATLRLMIIKSRGTLLLSKSGQNFGSNICDWKGQDFLSWINKETTQVESAIRDLAIAFPDSQTTFSEFLKQLQNILVPVKGQVSPPESTIREILDERAFKLGLEELSPCI